MMHWVPRPAGFRHAFTRLLRRPRYTAAILACLVVGLSTVAVMFGVLDAAFLQLPAGVSSPHPILRLWLPGQRVDRMRLPASAVALPVYEAIQVTRPAGVRWSAAGVVRTVVAYRGDPRSVNAAFVSEDYFASLGARPAVGRLLQRADTSLTQGVAAVVSAEFWTNVMGRDPAIVGRVLRVNDYLVEVVGVGSPGFQGVEGTEVDLWLPLAAAASVRDDSTMPRALDHVWLSVYAVLDRQEASGAATHAATHAVTQALGAVEATAPTVQFGVPQWIPAVHPAGFQVADPTSGIVISHGPIVWISLFAVAVFLVALSNAASLGMIETLRRRPEAAIRLALGAQVSHLSRDALAEGMLLGGFAVGAATFITVSARAVLRLVPYVPTSASMLTWRYVGFAGAVFVLCIVVLCVPVARSARALLATTRVPQSSTRNRRGVHWLITGQLVVTTTLLLLASVFWQRTRVLAAAAPPYDVERVIIVEPGVARLTMGRELSPLLEEAAARVAQLPGVTQVALATVSPFRSSFAGHVWRTEDRTSRLDVLVDAVDSGFFHLGGPVVLQGRAFSASDVQQGDLAIVNETLARLLFGERSPLGECLSGTLARGHCARIVGVVATAAYLHLDEAPRAMAYFPLQRGVSGIGARTMYVATRGSSRAVATGVGRILVDRDPRARDISVQTFGQVLGQELAPGRTRERVAVLFALIALVVSVLGVYAQLAYTVQLRDREFGIRRALGATAAGVRGLVFRAAATTLVVALPAGLAAACGILWLAAPGDGLSFRLVWLASGPVFVGATLVVFVAAWPSAVRAGRVTPSGLLRSE